MAVYFECRINKNTLLRRVMNKTVLNKTNIPEERISAEHQFKPITIIATFKF